MNLNCYKLEVIKQTLYRSYLNDIFTIIVYA